MKNVLKKLASFAILAAAAAAIYVIGSLPGRNRQAPPSETQPVNVEVEVVKPVESLPDTFDCSGVVEVNRVVRISAEVAGRIEHIAVEEGAPTRQGQVLMKFNDDLISAEVAQAEAQAAYDKIEFSRVSELFKKDFARQNEYDQVKMRSEVSQAMLKAATERLKRTTIVSPVSGVPNRVPAEVGEYVLPGTLVAEIVDADTVKIAVQVAERDVAMLKVGDVEQIFADSPRGGEKCAQGKISYISELADSNTRTSRVEISVDNASRELRSGQIVRVRLTRAVLKNVILVPLAAVIPLETGKEVYVVENGKASRRGVTLGVIKANRVQVLDEEGGLKSGDLLIVSGYRYVSDGQVVTVRQSDK